MTNVNKKAPPIDMQLHIESAFKIIEEHLPYQYVPKVISKLRDSEVINVSGATIRRIKTKGPVKPYNLPVITALLEVAKENQALSDNIARKLEFISDSHGNSAE